MAESLLELAVVAGAVGELEMPYAVLLAALIPLANVSTSILVPPAAHLNRSGAVLTLALVLALLVVSVLALLVVLLLVLVLNTRSGHAHTAH